MLVLPPALVVPPAPGEVVELEGEVVELEGEVVVVLVVGEPVVELVVGDVVEPLLPLLSESPPQPTQTAEIEARVMKEWRKYPVVPIGPKF